MRFSRNPQGKNLVFSSSLVFIDKPGVTVLHLTDQIKSPIAFGLQKDSEFTPIINYYIKKMIESGLMASTMRKWMKQPDEMFDIPDIPALGFRNVSFLFDITGQERGIFTKKHIKNSSCNAKHVVIRYFGPFSSYSPDKVIYLCEIFPSSKSN